MENKKIDAKIEQAESDVVAESEEKIKVELKPERIIDVDKAYEEGVSPRRIGMVRKELTAKQEDHMIESGMEKIKELKTQKGGK